ncbi:MAG: response regulator [Phycisphaerales bacterium]|jgi:CheY-like chemotaxis protein
MIDPKSRAGVTKTKPKIVSADRPNTLGLGQRELGALLDMIDAMDGGRKPVRREFARWPFRQTGVMFTIEHPGGSATNLKLACRNLSRGGISLLHAGFIHPGSRCRVTLTRTSGGSVDVPGEVKRCQHRQGTLHEFGIKFDRPINLSDFVGGNNREDFFSMELVKPETLKGRLLHVEDCELDATIVRHYLRETSIQTELVTCGTDAITKCVENFDIILCDWRLPDILGTEVVTRMRAMDVVAPVLMVTSDAIGLMKVGLWELSNVSMLTKPFTQEQLLRSLAERLLVTQNAPVSDAGTDGPVAKLAGVPTELVRPMIERLELAITTGDAKVAGDMCFQLKGVAPSLGMPAVGKACENALSAISQLKPGMEPPKLVKDLIMACKRALAA